MFEFGWFLQLGWGNTTHFRILDSSQYWKCSLVGQILCWCWNWQVFNWTRSSKLWMNLFPSFWILTFSWLSISNKKARRQTEEEVEMQEQVTVGGETLPLVNDHEVKKSKKRRRAEDQWRLLLLPGCLPFSLYLFDPALLYNQSNSFNSYTKSFFSFVFGVELLCLPIYS